jgi:hypothetical protein
MVLISLMGFAVKTNTIKLHTDGNITCSMGFAGYVTLKLHADGNITCKTH